MDIKEIIARDVDSRTETEQAHLETEVARIARSLPRGARRLMYALRNADREALVRIEGTDRFQVRRTREDGGRSNVREFCNPDLLPLLRAGLVQVEGLAHVGITTVTPLGKGVASHCWR
jgi:hypothetical protein